MPRLLFVSYHYPPGAAIGARRPARFARHLTETGFEVDVVCGSPLPGDGSGRPPPAISAPDPSQLGLVHDERRVTRVPTPFVFGRDPHADLSDLSPGARRWWKARAYAEWLLLTRDWEGRWGAAAAAAVEADLKAGRYDVLAVSVPPMWTATAPVLAAARAGVPVVADCRDLWLPASTEAGPAARLHPAKRRQQARDADLRTLYRLADRIVFATPEACDHVRSACDFIDGDRVRWVPNAFEEVDEGPETGPRTDAAVEHDAVRLLYSGSLAYGRDTQLLHLLKGLREARRSGLEALRLTIVSRLPDEVRETISTLELDDVVEIRGWMSRDRVLELQRSADALVLLQRPGRVGIETAIPAKLFEYMARRKNILSLSPVAADRVVGEHDLGVVVADTSPTGVAGALSELVGRVRARPLLPPPPDRFSAPATAARFADILRSCI